MKIVFHLERLRLRSLFSFTLLLCVKGFSPGCCCISSSSFVLLVLRFFRFFVFVPVLYTKCQCDFYFVGFFCVYCTSFIQLHDSFASFKSLNVWCLTPCILYRLVSRRRCFLSSSSDLSCFFYFEWVIIERYNSVFVIIKYRLVLKSEMFISIHSHTLTHSHKAIPTQFSRVLFFHCYIQSTSSWIVSSSFMHRTFPPRAHIMCTIFWLHHLLYIALFHL